MKFRHVKVFDSHHQSQGSEGLVVFKSGLKVDKPTMWSRVDHSVFVRSVKPTTNQFTVESFLKSGCRGGF